MSFTKYEEPESSTMEWKVSLPAIPKLLSTVVGFCNQYGGSIVIGVDNSGVVKGLSDETLHECLETLPNTLYSSCSPAVLAHIFPRQIEDKVVLVIEISEGMNKPYFVTSLGLQKGVFVRVGRSTVHATPEVLEELKWRSRGKSNDEFPVHGAKESDISLEKIKLFLKQRRKSKSAQVTPEVLRSYKIFQSDHFGKVPTTAGLLLFGTEPQHLLQEAVILCSHFKGVEGRNVLAQVECRGTLFEQYELALDFLLNHLPKAFRIKSSRREDHLAIPEIALREALTNLIVHRDYAVRSLAKIAIYSDRVEFFSPGVFPGPLTAKNLEAGITYIRNSTITKVFHEVGLIERLGSGFVTIFKIYRDQQMQKPSVIEGEGFVKCVLPVRSKLPLRDRTAENQLLDLFGAGEDLSISEISFRLKVSKATALRMLKLAVSKKQVVSVGRGPSTRYRPRGH